MRRWLRGIGIVVGSAVSGSTLACVLSTSSGCGRPLAPTPSGAGSASGPAQISAVKLAAAVPREALVAGHALVEFVAAVPAMLGGELESGERSLAAASKPWPTLSGVRVRLLRQVLPRDESAQARGPIVLLELPDLLADDPAATRRALAQLAADPSVARVEPDRIRHLATLPDDPLLPQQWSLPMIHMEQAWALSQGSPDVVVAILDTGMVYGHPDLDGRLVAGYDFVSNPQSAADGDDSRDSDPTDTGTVDTSRLHGLHVAGTIGAITDNGLGIAGVDQKCRLMPVRVLGINNGDGIDSDIADAILWASGVQVGQLPRPVQTAHILNMSFAGPGSSFTLQRAIDQALSRGVIVIAAAGNDMDDAATYSPGGLDGVITVGAVDPSGARATYSNYGPRVDLLAPGGGSLDANPSGGPDLGPGTLDGILSTYRDIGLSAPGKQPFTYETLVGTSQAAPHVSGAAALVRSLLPGLTQGPLGELLRAAADPQYQCPNSPLGGCGTGLLNVENLLNQALRQKSCGCADTLYCWDGTCIQPALAHPSVFDEPVIHGGYCQLVRPIATPLPPPLGPAVVMAALGGFAWRRQRRRERA